MLATVLTNLVTACALLQLLLEPQKRNPSLFDQRLKWDQFTSRHSERFLFKRHIRLPSLESFNKLLNLIRHDLVVDERMASLRGGPILPELQPHCTLRHLAGGSHSDSVHFAGISVPSHCSSIHKTMKAINQCPELSIVFPKTVPECDEASQGFQRISAHGSLWRVVSVVDGFFVKTHTPPKKVAGNV